MGTKPIENEIKSSPPATSNHVTIVTSNDEDTVKDIDRPDSIKKTRHSCFEWIHLIATIWIPIVIAVYAVVENNSNTSIAASNRLKEMEMANITRAFELRLALDNRLNEIEIAQQSRQKDRDLAADQQHQNLLVEYQTFLANLILDHGVNFSRKPDAKLVARFMTLTALDQLNTNRKSILLRTLFDARLITLRESDNPNGPTTVDLQNADLSNTIFGLWPNEPDIVLPHRYVMWTYLSLPDTILTNASFRHIGSDCLNFYRAKMDSVDLSFARSWVADCYQPQRQSQTNFVLASMVNASLYNTYFRFADFDRANLTFANLQKFYCVGCNFSSAKLFHADLSFSTIIKGFLLSGKRLDFTNAKLNHAIAHSAHYRSINFDESNWSHVQASKIRIYNCTFTNARMSSSSFTKSTIDISVFRNTNLYSIDLSDAELHYVSFLNSDMYNANLSDIKCNYCDFTNVTLHGGILKNASLRHSIFLNCRVSDSQLEEAIDLFGSTLPNGTVVGKSND